MLIFCHCLDVQPRTQPWSHPVAVLRRRWNHAASSRLCGRERREHTLMWKSMIDEAREVVWLASFVGGLSAVGVGVAVVLVAA